MVLLFISEYWALSDAMIRVAESTYVGFLLYITGKQVRHQFYRSCETLSYEEVLLAVGVQSAATYIHHWQDKISQWVSLRPPVEVCARKTCYEWGGRNIQPC